MKCGLKLQLPNMTHDESSVPSEEYMALNMLTGERGC